MFFKSEIRCLLSFPKLGTGVLLQNLNHMSMSFSKVKALKGWKHTSTVNIVKNIRSDERHEENDSLLSSAYNSFDMKMINVKKQIQAKQSTAKLIHRL